MKFKTLLEFVKYCEEVCDNIDDQDEDFFLLSTIAAATHINLERLLEDAAITLDAYYYWLLEAVQQEMYLCAAQIVTAKNCEIDHYIQLANTVIPEDSAQFKYGIIELDTQINNKYLGENE
jgi:hypothetical protein